MNKWTWLSIEYANQRSYLDDLFTVYPTIPEGIRDINEQTWQGIEANFISQNNVDLLKSLLKLPLFPIKDSYVAYLKKDPASIDRNPKTVDRICGRIYQLGLDQLFQRCSEPKETNRQIGPMFRTWLRKKHLGIAPVDLSSFLANDDNAILDGSDSVLKQFAQEHLNYHRDKGVDLIARFNGKYVLGEAKLLTDMGGHQNSQFHDAITTLDEKNVNAVLIAILDGVLYIKGRSKMFRFISNQYSDKRIMSSLVLREFLYQL